MDKTNVNQVKDTIAEQKANYEEHKEQERKRRFAILSGNIKPIQTSFHLKAGEHAYFQINADRMAERDYVESHTTGDARSPFIQGGLLRGNTAIRTETTQERIAKTEIIDSGTMLFTSLRMLFIGKEVISIPYDDMLSVEFSPYSRFDTTSLVVKYPAMLKNECYDLEKKNDAKLYYEGIMRLIGRDKSKITEAEVNMDDYPVFGHDEIKKGKKMNPIVRNILIGVGILIVLSAFFRPFIVPVNFILCILTFLTGFAYAGTFLSKNKNTTTNMDRKNIKNAFFWLLAILLMGLIVATSSNTSSTKNTVSNKQITQKQIQKPTIGPTLTAKQQEDMKLSVDGKKLKSTDDQVIDHEIFLAKKCEFLVNEVVDGNTSNLGSWSTAYDPIYDLDGQRADELTALQSDAKSSASANFATWQNLADTDDKIESDVGQIENQCDYLSSDPQGLNSGNISTYESTVKSFQLDIDNLMVQRKSDITILTTNKQL